MGASIIQIIDLILTLYLTHLFGDYLILAIISSLSLAGIFFSYISVNSRIRQINTSCGEGCFPENLFNQLTGTFFAAVLLFMPGFISSFFGFLLLFPLFSIPAGRYISRNSDTEWHTVYEYMKI
ncbi:MAG: FxsA family protein [Spirochaetales bacterium]|nr:FxsA family protein [Spirochaetales bacterium]